MEYGKHGMEYGKHGIEYGKHGMEFIKHGILIEVYRDITSQPFSYWEYDMCMYNLVDKYL